MENARSAMFVRDVTGSSSSSEGHCRQIVKNILIYFDNLVNWGLETVFREKLVLFPFPEGQMILGKVVMNQGCRRSIGIESLQSRLRGILRVLARCAVIHLHAF
jgi:hypothetical protein